MLEVTPNKELLKIKNTMFLGFTGRQVIAFFLGMVVGTILFLVVPIPLFLKPALLLIAIGVVMLPLLFSWDGMNLLQFIGAIIDSFWGKPLVCENNIDKEVRINGRNRNREKRYGKNKKTKNMSGYDTY